METLVALVLVMLMEKRAEKALALTYCLDTVRPSL
jgi:hypothetical protein